MARALQDILTELNSVYAPQRDLYNTQLNTLDPQMQAEEKGLQAQQQDSFNQITQGANRRGLLFSGIPLQEQASYTGQSFLPAVANLKAKYAQQKFNLQDALAKINQDQYNSAYGIYSDELSRDEAARSRAGSGGGFNPTLANPTKTTTAASGGGAYSSVPPELQTLYNQMFLKGDGSYWGDQELLNDYNASLKSARYGNSRDKQKILLYHSVRPDLFPGGVPSSVLANGQNVSF